MFKKKSLKFTFEKVSRDLRHAETLKARESSRFKRLSMIRSINENDSDFSDKTMETPKEVELKEPEKKKPSRLEMLFKWKQEKQLKKEMEKQAKKKPFYVGGKKDVIDNKAVPNFKSSFIGQPNSSFNTSKFVKSKLGVPTATVQPSKIQSSKQGNVSSKIQPPKLPNSKQVVPSTSSSSKIPNSKQIVSSVPKSSSNLCRSNSTATLSRKFPASANDKMPKSGSNLTRSNSTAVLSRKLPIPSSGISKAAASKPVNNIQKAITPINRISKNVPNAANATSKNVSSKPVNKGSSVPKPQEEKSVKKTGTNLPKLTSNVTNILKGIPVQSKMPILSMNNKFGLNPKLNQKEASQSKENTSSRKGYCFKTAIANSSHQRAGTLLKTPMQGTPKKLQEKISKDTVKIAPTEEFPEQSMDGFPDVTFNSDISIIKPARTSFAPANFTFRPPDGLNDFVFEDDCDVYQVLEEVKLKYMSRTSTPSKDSLRKSSAENSTETSNSSNLRTDVEKVSNTSNSDDKQISELMSPESVDRKTENKEAVETVNREISNAYDVVTNIEIKDVDIVVNQQTEETNVAVNQEAKEKFDFISQLETENKESDKTVNTEISNACDIIKNIEIKDVNICIDQRTLEETTDALSREICEKFHTIPSVETENKVNETINQQNSKIKQELNKPVEGNGELQKCLFGEKQPLNDSNITENSNKNDVEVSSNEKQCNESIMIAASDRTIDAFLDDDDSLIDSIDLNKIQLMKSDDEDSNEDDVPSPQVLKCSERISNGAIPKRVSMLKKMSFMNSIAETSETEESGNPTGSPTKNHNTSITPRRSKRITNSCFVDTSSHSPVRSNIVSPNATPRRSLRLLKISNVDNYPVSPVGEKKANSSSRRSMRLIDLSTPEKATCEKILGENFENLDPNDFLIDFESPGKSVLPKNRKVSLLYSPEKRKSIRKSIRGDLISFSPV